MAGDIYCGRGTDTCVERITERENGFIDLAISVFGESGSILLLKANDY